MVAGAKKKKTVPGTRVLKDGTYEAILVVPADCRERVGKKNLTRRLGTTRYADAAKLAPPILREFESIIQAARAGASVPAKSIDPKTALRAIERWRVAELARAELRAFNEPDEAIPDPEANPDEYLAFRARYHELRYPLSRQGRWADIPGFDERLLNVLEEFGIKVSVTHPAMARLRPVFQTAWREVVAYEDGLRNGDIAPGHSLSPINSGSDSATSLIVEPSDEVTVWGAFVKWRQKRVPVGQEAGKTAREFETQIKRFIDVHGDLPLHKITRRHCLEFRDLMAQYPAHLPAAMRTESIRNVVARYTANGAAPYKRLEPKTLNEKVFAALRAVFADAASDSETFVNPMSNISVDYVDGPPTKLPYTTSEMGKLFRSAVFVGQPVSDKRAGDKAQKWLPLLAAYSGARLEELAQLAVTDFKEEAGIPFIHFQVRYDGVDPGYLRSLKNAPSHRKVPIHSVLLDLGILQLVNSQRESGGVHLFPAMDWDERKKRDKTFKVSGYFSKWWSSYSRPIVPDTRKSFHSFRHTFKNCLRNAGVAKALDDALTGHASSDEAGRYGRDEEGLGFRLPILAEAIEKLSHPAIELRAIV